MKFYQYQLREILVLTLVSDLEFLNFRTERGYIIDSEVKP